MSFLLLTHLSYVQATIGLTTENLALRIFIECNRSRCKANCKYASNTDVETLAVFASFSGLYVS